MNRNPRRLRSFEIAFERSVSAGICETVRQRLTIGLPVDERPEVRVEAALALLRLEDARRVVHRRLDLQPVADDPGIGEQALDVLRAEARDDRRIEARERAPIALALVEDRRPRESCLRALEREHLEQMDVVVRRDSPLLVVVGDHQLAHTRGPIAARHARHRWVGSQTVRPLLVVLVALALLAGCGGEDDDGSSAGGDTTTVTECAEVDAPEAREPEAAEAPAERARRVEDVHADVRHELRIVHHHARSRAGSEDRRLPRSARERGLLRRHDLPPRRAGLRDPGRRPDAVRWRWTWLLDRRRPGVRTRRTRKASSRWRSPASKRPEPPGASSSSSRATDAGSDRPSTRSSAK